MGLREQALKEHQDRLAAVRLSNQSRLSSVIKHELGLRSTDGPEWEWAKDGASVITDDIAFRVSVDAAGYHYGDHLYAEVLCRVCRKRPAATGQVESIADLGEILAQAQKRGARCAGIVCHNNMPIPREV